MIDCRTLCSGRLNLPILRKTIHHHKNTQNRLSHNLKCPQIVKVGGKKCEIFGKRYKNIQKSARALAYMRKKCYLCSRF